MNRAEVRRHLLESMLPYRRPSWWQFWKLPAYKRQVKALTAPHQGTAVSGIMWFDDSSRTPEGWFIYRPSIESPDQRAKK